MKKDPNKRTPEQQRFYKTAKWRKFRASYLASVGGLCERCKAKGKIVPAEIVHHRIYLDANNINDPDISLSFNSVEALCRKCHADEHNPNPRRYELDENGRVIAKEHTKYDELNHSLNMQGMRYCIDENGRVHGI